MKRRFGLNCQTVDLIFVSVAEGSSSTQMRDFTVVVPYLNTCAISNC